MDIYMCIMSTLSYEILQQPLTLPCGAKLKNRLVKSAMSDSLGDGSGTPTPEQIRLYERWAEGGVALSVIGEVQVDPRFPEKPGNLVLASESIHKPEPWKELIRRATLNGAHLWPQLGHAGALSHAPIHKPKGPSAVESLQCDALSLDEIHALPSQYAKAATQAKTLGFTGVLIHAGHGFLLSQFLCPLFNLRTDEYGSQSIANRYRIIDEIIGAVRQAVGSTFPVGIRINSSDMIQGGLTEDDALEVIKLLDRTTVDLIDISGGTYFPGAASASETSSSGSSKGPSFLPFCQRARALTTKPLQLTGGFKTRRQAIDVMASGASDLIGVARALCINVDQAKRWLSSNRSKDDTDPVFPRFEKTVPGGVTAWYTMKLAAFGRNEEDSFDLDLPRAVQLYEERDAERTRLWKACFHV